MVDSFFAKSSRSKSRVSSLKRKRAPEKEKKTPRAGRAPQKRRRREDSVEDVEGPTALSDEDVRASPLPESDGEEDENETPAQKRLRLAKAYIASLEDAQRQGADDFDAAEIDRDLIAARLQQDVLAESGDMHIFIADLVSQPLPADIHYTSSSKGHRLSVTAAVASKDGRYLYTASKDGSIAKWQLAQAIVEGEGAPISRLVYCPKHVASKVFDKPSRKGKEADRGPQTIGHAGEILSLSINDEGTIVASASTDRLLGVWDVEGEACVWKGGLRGHKDTVVAVSFRKGTSQAYTAAYDRTLKAWDLSTLSYIETLFGHQDRIHSLDCLRGETPISAGGRDKSLRLWKVTEENQLVFRGGVTSRIRDVIEGAAVDEAPEEASRKEQRYIEFSTDCVAIIDDGHFLSGGDSGTIFLWSTTRKKPIFSKALAHGLDEHVSETEGLQKRARWITALACLPYGDVFASGSWDGSIRLWKVDRSLHSFEALFAITAEGFVNSLQLVQPSTDEMPLVVAALGQEPRLGRWQRLKEAKNRAVVFRLARAV